MAVKTRTRAAQRVMAAEFTFDVANDTMTNSSGVSDNFNTVASHIFDVINLPIGAVVIGGEVATETAVSGSTAYNVSVGDPTTANRYLNAVNCVAAGRQALVPTGYFNANGEHIRVTVAPTAATATAGVITVRVLFAIRNRAEEVYST